MKKPMKPKPLEEVQEEEQETGKPQLLYCAYFNQAIRELDWADVPSNCHVVGDSRNNVVNEDSALIALGIFRKLYPNEEYLPSTPHPEEAATVEAILLEEQKQQEQEQQEQQEQEQEQ